MSRRRRRKKEENNHIDESWLIPYADLLTLVLALFIVLFAASSVDAQKFQMLSRVFNDIFIGGSGVMDYPQPSPQDDASLSDGLKKEDQKAAAIQTTEVPTQPSDLEKKIQLHKLDQEELKQIQAKINQYIKENHLQVKFATSLTDEGLLLTIRDNVLFDSGKAEVKKSNLDVAHELSKLLVMDPPRDIIISGHTDNEPIHNSKFDSNWELSVMRAVNFMKIMLENKNLDPRWFSAKGFGEFQPIASNQTAEGRSKNRRVEVLILPRHNLPEQ
ncbi:flagellar motor protein MotB [Falsibacillus albus]|uniref:Flagellar motor protein MotB n=1 Tax=Falsibacillus albus TaxID=2478915 RepID=A0A3L7K1E1_9BACI|nr:flagellar motor protein MotB [Falsibacillus albus]RLQ94482.1 flagellar motor protein MotB [Falsibacillus albus]